MLIHSIDSSPHTVARAPAGDVAPAHAPDPAGAVPAPAAAAPTAEAIESAVVRTNRAMAALTSSVQFVVDPDTKITVVKIVDTASNEVLRQVPSEEMLEIARALDRVQGLLLRAKV